MNSSTCVLFRWNDQCYAVHMDAVEEVLGLPRLTVVPDAPRHLAGVLDLRGTIVPVLDLSIWLGRSATRFLVTDNLIVLRDGGHRFGIIVNHVMDICSIPGPATTGRDETSGISSPIIARTVRVNQEIVFLLDREALVRFAEFAKRSISSSLPAPLSDTAERAFFRGVPLEEQQVFHERAGRLMLEEESVSGQSGSVALAVVGINGEYFGMPLEFVREFAKPRDITPVPCCPEYIVGNMNLRGEVLTVIDVRPVLGMPLSTAPMDGIVVADHGPWAVGILVEEVQAVIHLDPARITNRLSTTGAGANPYWSGTAAYGNRILTILDLRQIMESEALVVNDEA